jgi:DNA polymerase III epsilon subunit-like protein
VGSKKGDAMTKILVVDIESSGFSYIKDVILEIGIVSLCLKTGAIETLFDSCVREPHLSARHRNSWIFSNSDLTPDQIRSAPTMEEIRPKVQSIFSAYSGMTAFNCKFDFGFLRNRNFALPKELSCPMILSTEILKLPPKNGYPGYKWPSAQEAWDYYFPDFPYTEKHRGCADAEMEARIIYKMHTKGQYQI